MSLGLVGLLIAASGEVPAAPRTWTNREGKAIEAEFVSIVGDKARVRLTGGRTYDLPIASLSDEDQEFLRQEKERAAQASAAGKAGDLSKRRAKWTEDWEDAQKEAKETGLPILLFMTGSDWCGYCMQLDRNVFEEREFQRFADAHVVLMKADFPQGTQSRALKEQNAALRETYPASGFPTVYLLDQELKEVAKFTGYGGDPAKDYIAKVEAKLPPRK
jgi:protein disulfide-isomerase